MPESFVVDSSGKAKIVKDPNAVLDYTFDWAQWLPLGDTIVAAACAVSGDLSASISGVFNDTTKVTAWVQGGTVGSTVTLRCRITTVAGRIDDRSVYLKIKER